MAETKVLGLKMTRLRRLLKPGRTGRLRPTLIGPVRQKTLINPGIHYCIPGKNTFSGNEYSNSDSVSDNIPVLQYNILTLGSYGLIFMGNGNGNY